MTRTERAKLKSKLLHQQLKSELSQPITEKRESHRLESDNFRRTGSLD